MAEVDITDTLEYDRSVVGIDYDVGTHEITKDGIARFAEVIGETNPLYLDEDAAKNGPYGIIVAPPAYYTSIHLEPGPNPKVQFGNIGFNAS